MKVEIENRSVRIYGGGKVQLLITLVENKEGDCFMSSLCFDGFEHGCLPMIEVKGDDIIIQNNLQGGRFLYK